MAIEKLIVALKREYPDVGRAEDSGAPAPALAGRALSRHQHRPRRARPPRPGDPPGPRAGVGPTGTALSWPDQPNALWCADYKGEFMLADRRYCYPLTITDFASRYLLRCEALSTTQERYAFTVFEQVFKEFGLPAAIRTDNGVPFASPNALYGLSSCRSGGCASASRSNASSPVIPSRTAATSGCISHSRPKRPSPPPRTFSSNKRASMPSSTASTTSGRIRPWTCRCPASSIPPSPRPYRGLTDAGLPLPRLDGRRHPLRAPLLRPPEGESQPGLRRPAGGRPPGDGPHLARELYGLRLGLL